MSKIILLLFSFVLIFTSCKKIKGNAVEIEGTYEWAYSYTTSTNGSHGINSTAYEYPTNDKRIAVKIEKRKIIFFVNGQEVDRFSIRKITVTESSISLRFQRKKKDTAIGMYKDSNILYSSYFPITSGEENHVFYKN